MRNKVKTKIIATIGPGTNTEEKIAALVKAGANIFRLNSSHETPEIHGERVKTIRKLAKSLNATVGILLDLQGPKIRVGNLEKSIDLKEGAEIKIKPVLTTDGTYIPVDYKGILNDVKKGDKILLDDGKLELKVLSVNSEYANALVIHGGELKARKGLNIPGTTASISAVTERDIEFIKFSVEHNVDFVALSFVRAKEDILKAKHYIKKFGGNIPVIAKIEKPQALDNLEAIITASDGIMVARGDLGIEISPEKVPIVQKQIINATNAQRKAVIVATQMLESMIENAIPTRAEASDVANAIIDGADAVMLSGETAVGKFAPETVNMMQMIAKNVEDSNLCVHNGYTIPAKELYETDSQAICAAIMRMIDEIEISAIIAIDKSGHTSALLSKAKPGIPIIAISNDEQVCRRANIYWDVYPYKMNLGKSIDEKALKELDKMLINETFISPGDKVIITGSLPHLVTGKTNFIRLYQVGSAVTMF